MLFLYNLLFPLVFPIFLPAMIIKLIRRSGWKSTFLERFGIYSKQRKIELGEWHGAIWLHAVSVGETNLTLSLLNEWVKLEPNRKFILSTTTTTAQEIARKKAPAQVKVIFFPLDYAPIISHVLNLLQPSMVVILETELWPQLIFACKKRSIPLMLANMRISDHSYRGYYRFRIFFAPLLSCFNHIFAQTDLDRDRIISICPIAANRIQVCGNIKFDQKSPDGPGFDFKAEFSHISDPLVVLAASTHQPEESLILSSYLQVKRDIPNLCLVIVPRHAERGNELEAMLKDNHVSYHRRSNHSGLSSEYDVLLADTTGELPYLIKGADFIIMGKTLAGNNEGQNIIEPAIMGKPIICGPQLINFRQALDILDKNQAICRIQSDDELSNAIRKLTVDSSERNRLGTMAQKVMLQSRGATNKILTALIAQSPTLSMVSNEFNHSHKNHIRHLFLFLAFFMPFLWMSVLRVTTFSVGENSQDGLYHAAMAELGPSVYMSKHFDWAQTSIWYKHFSDKELLYHASMDLLFRFEHLFGIAVQPPFHFAALFYIALAIGGFLYAGCKLRIRSELLFAGSLLFSLIVPTFTFRLSLLRPHVLSIACLMFTTGLMVHKSFRFRLFAISILSFFFAWTYSNPHFIVIVPLVFSSIHAFKNDGGKRELLIPLVSFVAVMLGLIIHPQFPNSFLIWKTQSWDALISPMQANANLSKPMEMMPPSFGFHKSTFPFYLMFWLCVIMFCRISERIGFTKINWHLFPLAILSSAFTVGTFMAARAIEYAVPFSTLFFLLLIEEFLNAKIIPFFSRFKYAMVTFLLIASVSVAFFSTSRFRRDCPQVISTPIPQLTAYLAEHVPAKTPVINLDWSDFPILFYYDRNHYWQWGMDPMFSYINDPKRTMMLTKTRPGHGGQTYPQDLYQAFGCKYAVILWPRVPHASSLYEAGWKLVKAFTEKGKEEGWIFALDERSLHPTSAQFKNEAEESEKKQEMMRDNPT